MSDDRYPNRAGHKGRSETGKAGADGFQHKLARCQREALVAVEALGIASAEEVAAFTGRHWYVVRPRLSELSAKGLVADSGQRGPGAGGGRVIRWLPTSAEQRAIFAARKAAEAEKSGADK